MHTDTAPGAWPPFVGQVQTPPDVARWMADRAVRALIHGDRHHAPIVFEPAAGHSRLIAAWCEAYARCHRSDGSLNTRHVQDTIEPRPCDPAAYLFALESVHAIDIDPHAREAAVATLLANMAPQSDARSGDTIEAHIRDWAARNFRIGDALLDDPLMPDRPIDLVLGNPPYLGVRQARQHPHFAAWRRRFGAAEDLYAFFLRRAFESVRPGGHVIFLVPDGWMTLAGYAHLRATILAGTVLAILRLPLSTFDRTVYTSVLHWQRTPAVANHQIEWLDARASNDVSCPQMCHAPQGATAASGIFIAPMEAPAELNALLAPQRQPPKHPVIRLGDAYEILDHGIHSRNCRHRLFHAQPLHARFCRLVQGRQITPFRVQWDAPAARYRWVDIHYTPQPGVKGRRRDGSPSHRDEYWHWQGRPELFHRPERLLIRQTGDRLIAARCLQDGTTHYNDNTLLTAIETENGRALGLDLLFAAGFLNAALTTRLYQMRSGERGRVHAQIKVRLLRALPLPIPTPDERDEIRELARRAEADAAAGRLDTTLLNRCIERLFSRTHAAILRTGAAPTAAPEDLRD